MYLPFALDVDTSQILSGVTRPCAHVVQLTDSLPEGQKDLKGLETPAQGHMVSLLEEHLKHKNVRSDDFPHPSEH